MSNSETHLDPADVRWPALSRWENEGGAFRSATCEPSVDIPELTNTDLVQLRIRLIALENLMIAILAEDSKWRGQLACDIAAYISPRPGFTHHPLTLKAANHMTALIRRAVHFRTMPS
jgi:hypothetical protein